VEEITGHGDDFPQMRGRTRGQRPHEEQANQGGSYESRVDPRDALLEEDPGAAAVVPAMDDQKPADHEEGIHRQCAPVGPPVSQSPEGFSPYGSAMTKQEHERMRIDDERGQDQPQKVEVVPFSSV